MMAKNQIETQYDQLSNEFFDLFYTYCSPHATRQGLHQYDNVLGHFKREEIAETLRRMKSVQKQVAAINPESMDRLHALDHPVLTTRMKREIYWIETWRFWENNPLFYKDVILEGMFNLVSRNFASLDARLNSLIQRQKEVPEVLKAACANLVNPPYEYTSQAIDQFKGAISFFEKLPESFQSVENDALRAEFKETNEMVIAEIKQFLIFLEEDLLPRSHGNFAVGEDEIQNIIDVEEMIDVPVKDILARCYQDLDRTEKEIAKLQTEIDPTATLEDLIDRMRQDHPAADKLKESIQAELKRV